MSDAIVIPFPDPERRASDRTLALMRHADVDGLAASLGTPEEWLTSAILHLKVASSCRADGAAEVAVAALHLVLAHVEQLEGRLGIIPPPSAA